MLVHHDLQPASVALQRTRSICKLQVLKAYRVVAVDRTLELQREDQVQIPATERPTNALPRCAAGT